ncbi:unnamed protein product [Prunus armeniaca]|uniref:Uncharacterized protein n=1 Tax=Prunus armeniaca TaxID=36596 RepID=A0A6J5V712_PRUAR|nr:unnamed protein product [Prunus armeniaca]
MEGLQPSGHNMSLPVCHCGCKRWSKLYYKAMYNILLKTIPSGWRRRIGIIERHVHIKQRCGDFEMSRRNNARVFTILGGFEHIIIETKANSTLWLEFPQQLMSEVGPTYPISKITEINMKIRVHDINGTPRPPNKNYNGS